MRPMRSRLNLTTVLPEPQDYHLMLLLAICHDNSLISNL